MPQSERFDEQSSVKGTMLKAHLAWADKKFGDLKPLDPHLDPKAKELLKKPILATNWVLFKHLIGIDRAIAAAAGGDETEIYDELGRHSAHDNLQGVYRSFISTEPHRFFENMTILHPRFQSFGRSKYEKVGERQGIIKLEGYPVYSPVFCTTGRGYYRGALEMMHVPGPVEVKETICHCFGHLACVFELSW